LFTITLYVGCVELSTEASNLGRKLNSPPEYSHCILPCAFVLKVFNIEDSSFVYKPLLTPCAYSKSSGSSHQDESSAM